MKKRTVIIIFAVIFVVSLSLSLLEITGNYIAYPSGYLKGCIDSDDGLNYEEKGTATYENRNYSYTDYCRTEFRLKEYYCFTDFKIKAKEQRCPNGCQDGACK